MSLLRATRAVVQHYQASTVTLWKHSQRARKLRLDQRSLTRAEQRFVADTSYNVRVTVPLMMAIWVPVAGYVVLLLPTVLLPRSCPPVFRSSEQTRLLDCEDDHNRQLHQALMLNAHPLLLPSPPSATFDDALRTTLDHEGRNSLNTLVRAAHTTLLPSAVVMLCPHLAPVVQLLPPVVLEHALARQVDALLADDALILKEGTNQWSDAEWRTALRERGLSRGDKSDPAADAAALHKWLDLTRPLSRALSSPDVPLPAHYAAMVASLSALLGRHSGPIAGGDGPSAMWSWSVVASLLILAL
jgi:hypothetical protein